MNQKVFFSSAAELGVQHPCFYARRATRCGVGGQRAACCRSNQPIDVGELRTAIKGRLAARYYGASARGVSAADEAALQLAQAALTGDRKAAADCLLSAQGEQTRSALAAAAPLIEASADRLRDDWMTDEISEFEVSTALCTLQSALRSVTATASPSIAAARGTILVTTVPGERDFAGRRSDVGAARGGWLRRRLQTVEDLRRPHDVACGDLVRRGHPSLESGVSRTGTPDGGCAPYQLRARRVAQPRVNRSSPRGLFCRRRDGSRLGRGDGRQQRLQIRGFAGRMDMGTRRRRSGLRGRASPSDKARPCRHPTFWPAELAKLSIQAAASTNRNLADPALAFGRRNLRRPRLPGEGSSHGCRESGKEDVRISSKKSRSFPGTILEYTWRSGAKNGRLDGCEPRIIAIYVDSRIAPPAVLTSIPGRGAGKEQRTPSGRLSRRFPRNVAERRASGASRV